VFRHAGAKFGVMKQRNADLVESPTVNPTQSSERSNLWLAFLAGREEQVFLVLTLSIGALVGLAVVAFIPVTERFGARLYPAGGAAWRRVLIPTIGSLGMGYLLFRFFSDARGSGVPQTKAALYAREGRISLKTWENFSARRRRSPAVFRLEEKDRRFK
jgi:hypothetical protein